MSLFERPRETRKAEERDLRRNREEIRTTNRRNFHILIGLGLACFGAMFALSFLSRTYRPLRVPYLVLVGLLLLLLTLERAFQRQVSPTFALYSVFVVIGVYAAFTSAFVTPEYTCVTILGVLSVMPILMLDSSRRVNLVETLLAAVYLACVLPCKDARLVQDEAVNVVLFGMIAAVVGAYQRQARIDSIELKRQAVERENTDFLTGLGSRRPLFRRLIAYGGQPGENQIGLLLMVDIDFFKAFNDTYGHQAGDECLRRLAACFAALAERYGAQFYRYGGEEFAGIFPGNPEPDALCRELTEGVAALRIPHTASETGFVSVSVGAAQAGGERDYGELLLHADYALYAAKRGGRNRAVVYRPGEERQFPGFEPSFH